jgi:hypothetical protein
VVLVTEQSRRLTTSKKCRLISLIVLAAPQKTALKENDADF